MVAGAWQAAGTGITPGGLLRGLVAAIPAGAAVTLWRGADEVFAVVHATVLWQGALAGLAVAALIAGRLRRLPVPAPGLVLAGGAYLAALLAATASADGIALAVAGRAGRHTGLATAVAAVVIGAVAAWALRDRPALAVRTALLAAAVPVGGYALVQAVGADPLEWRYIEGGPAVFSTLGNASFLSGWAGAVLPLAAWGVLDEGVRPGRRVAAAGVGALLAAAILASGSLQGLVAGGLGTGVTVAGWWTGRPRPPPQRRAVLAVGAAAVAALAAGAGELIAELTRSLGTRLVHWQTAWRMATDRPLTGVGLEEFAGWFRVYEAPAAAAERGLERSLDSPHNIALEHLAEGGWPLLAAWLAVVAVVAIALVRGWRREAGQRRLALAGVGGAWLAYLLQALVSIDVPALAALGAVLAGATLALGAPGWLGHRPVAAGPARAAAGTLLALAVAGATIASVPLRADLAAGTGTRAATAEARADALARARELAPWEPRYAALDGARRNRAGDRAGAIAAYEDARRADPRSVATLLSLARLAVAHGDESLAADAYADAVAVAPHTPEVLAEAGSHALGRGDAERARTLLERALACGVERRAWWRDLAEAREALSDSAGAEAARERARQLELSGDNGDNGDGGDG